MIRTVVASSLGEGDYLPNGDFAVSVPTVGVQTNHGLLPLPPGESAVRYPALRSDGQIAGQPQNSVRGAWVWTGSEWDTDARIPASPNPCIYDNGGVLYVNELGPNYVGSQGYQYVTPSNVIIPGQTTYAPLGEWWERQSTPDLTCCWGGRFTTVDADHFSIEHEGVK